MIVTGAGSGIGRCVAAAFAAVGARVVIAERNNVTGEDAVRYIREQGGEVSFIMTDVSVPGQVTAMVRATAEKYGVIDIVINNAGVQNEEDIDVNLKGTIGITEKYGIRPGIRSVLMIGSASGHNGSEFPEYVASKGGVLSYTKNVALRIAKYGAVCNSLDFGGVLTELNKPVMEDKALWDEIMEQTPLKRWMTVEETADWAYFMTVTNRFCTGQNILIDGLEAGNAHFVWPETDN